jgi:hypothetical protein
MGNNEFSSFEGFSATIQGISIFDYMQLLIMTNKRKLVEIKTNNKIGYIAIDEGKIIFSKMVDGDFELEGLDAFLTIMTWRNGFFKDMEIFGNIRKNIDDNRNLLLLATEAIDKERIKKYTVNSEILPDLPIDL